MARGLLPVLVPLYPQNRSILGVETHRRTRADVKVSVEPNFEVDFDLYVGFSSKHLIFMQLEKYTLIIILKP